MPEWFALIHEFSSDGEIVTNDETSKWFSKMRNIAEKRLCSETDNIIRTEHRIATVLNPRLKHLPIICTDLQRFFIFFFVFYIDSWF